MTCNTRCDRVEKPVLATTPFRTSRSESERELLSPNEPDKSDVHYLKIASEGHESNNSIVGSSDEGLGSCLTNQGVSGIVQVAEFIV